MVREGALPNARTYTVVVEHLASAGFLDEALRVFRLLPSLRAPRTTRQYDVLGSALAEAARFDLLRWLIREMVAVDGVLPGPQMRAAIAAMRESGHIDDITEDFADELSPNGKIGYAVDDVDGEGDIDSDSDEDNGDVTARITLKPWLDPRELARALEGWDQREVAELESAGIVWTPRLVCKLLRSFRKAETAWEFFCWVACQPGGFAHDRHTVARMVAILARAGHVELVERLLDKVRSDGIALPFATVRLVVDFYGLSKKPDAAIRVFREADAICGGVGRPNLGLLCSSLLRTLAKCGRGDDAVELVEEMVAKGLVPDLQTFSGLMEHLAGGGDLKGVHRLLGMVRQCEMQPDGYMYSVLIRAYCKRERAALALKLFDEMRGAGVKPDAPTKALLVKSLWREGKLREAAQVEERCDEMTAASEGLPEASPGHVWTATAADLEKSRKSTQSRQRQYFEQKKRQQQRPGAQSQVDVAGTGSQAYHDQAPRSLDVLNLNNLATPICHNSGPENVDSVVPPLDFSPLNASAIEAQKVTSVCGNLKEASSQPRTLPLPPKVMRYAQNKARRSIPFNATKELDSVINGINVLKERRFPENMISPLDESAYKRSKQFNCNFPHSFDNHDNKFFPEDEDMFYEQEAEKGWQSRLDDTLTDENSERLWKMKSFNSEDHFPTPRVKQFDTLDYGLKDRYSPEKRTSTRTNTRFETSGIPATHDLFSDHPLMGNGDGTVLFDWERHPPIKKISNSNNTFGPSAWSFDMTILYSEESCSSATVVKDGSCKKPSLSVECEENKMKEKDDFHISFDKLDIPRMDANLDGISLFNNLEEHHKRTDDQNNLEAGYWSDKATKKQRTREPSCRLSLKEKFSNWDSTSTTTHLKDGTGLNNPSSCTVLLHEDNPFNSVSDMSTYQTAGSSSPERRPASKVPPVFHRPGNAIFDDDIDLQRPARRPASKVRPVFHRSDNAIFDDDIDLQRPERKPASKVPPVFHRPENAIFDDDIDLQSPVSDICGDEIEFSKPNSSTCIKSDIDMSTFLAEKVDKRKEDNFDSSKNRNADMFLEKKSVSSVSQNIVGQHRSCPQQPGKDSLRQGLSPGIDFQDSRLNSFWEDDHADNGTFQGDIELSNLLARKNGDDEDKIKKLSKPETKMLTETPRAYADYRNEMGETEICSEGSEVTNPPGVQKQTSLVTQVPANLGCLQETSTEMLQVHAHVECVTRENIENPSVALNTPLHLRNKIPDVDHSKSNFMLHSPFVGEEVGIEKKIIASVSPNNSDVQYKVMFEHRVLRRLCVQKIVVDTPTKNKLEKDTHFRRMEDGYHVLPRSV
uniref:Pentatricopeptide repeat-containing protein n=1 Tax=Leersia perrieri TaxID=77586 RepID=A0A0D9UX76_9ORYZ